ncbi:DUF2279 domain-containing protein [Hymenobacter humi]|uniref:DUF2279 domain-containing protein n=1 Tax=Hymenobacter humi TaxID=1411620 RepID=A0ABW2U9W9_9BACT
MPRPGSCPPGWPPLPPSIQPRYAGGGGACWWAVRPSATAFFIPALLPPGTRASARRCTGSTTFRSGSRLDKAGHFWGSFQESRGAVDMLRWAGLSEQKALWYGSFVGFAIQSPLELLDGRDPAYGASATDLAANFLGSSALLAQQLAWHDIRIMPKWSFHLSPYAPQRPNVLGKSVPERWLKDYNGQTYWLCTDVGAFLKPGNRWPRWLQPAVGYGGEDMVYNDDGTNAAAGLRPYRQFYLSLDVDLRRIPTRSALLKKVFYTLSIFHLPAPALEYNGRNGFRFHGLYM